MSSSRPAVDAVQIAREDSWVVHAGLLGPSLDVLLRLMVRSWSVAKLGHLPYANDS